MNNHKWMLTFWLICFIAACGKNNNQEGFDFSDLEQLEHAAQGELLAQAKQAASDWHFSKAESLLVQAQQKGRRLSKLSVIIEMPLTQSKSVSAKKKHNA